jgi:hypothetical protein
MGGEGGAVAAGGLYCASCHQGSHPVPHSTNVTLLGSTCAACHTGTSGTNGTGDAHAILPYTALSTLNNTLCENCHSQATTGNPSHTVYTQYMASVHAGSDGLTGHSSCAACHTGSHDSTVHADATNVNPVTFVVMTSNSVQQVSGTKLAKGSVFCSSCHGTLHLTTGLSKTCAQCHMKAADVVTITTPVAPVLTGTLQVAVGAASVGTDAHNVQALGDCVSCHAGALTNLSAAMVNDNSGVRAIIPEFLKTSHHIYNGPNGLPVAAQCAICHLEGKVNPYGGGVSVDSTYHMADKWVHLRNADSDVDFKWDPSAAAPDFTGMDNFCFSCHDANGATSPKVKLIQGQMSTLHLTPAKATASNPFGDLLSNKYDQVTRAAVVNVFDAMDPNNASHHAVRNAKYSTRSSATARTNGTMDSTQSTLFDGSLFTNYIPEGAGTTTVGDDSTLHCGDCHTVGQWSTVQADYNVAGKYNTAAIGAHGSNSEYMLRNTLGSDAQGVKTNTATVAGYVCYICHNQAKNATTANPIGTWYSAGAHIAGINSSCNVDTTGKIGSGFLRYTTYHGTTTDTHVAYTAQNGIYTTGTRMASAGNITGISCTNCHNSGIRGGNALNTPSLENGFGSSNPTTNSGFGGIHGGNAAYTNYLGQNQAPARFMSGMGNYKYAPAPNTFNGTSIKNQPVSVAGTCYTNNGTAENAGYSSCNHHNAQHSENTGAGPYRGGGTLGNVARPLSY